MQLYWKSVEKHKEKRAWEMWLMRYQHMTDKNFMPFSQFFKGQTKAISAKDKNEILQDVERIRNARKKEGE